MTYSKTQIKNRIYKLASNWNPDYWIYSADGHLYLMQNGEDGEHEMLPNGGVDPRAIVYIANIPSDGGDW